MRRETEWWIAQAEKELQTAKKNLEIGEYYAAAFFSHQCAEAAIKALFIAKKKELPEIHSLVQLLEGIQNDVDVPIEFMSKARYLNPHYIITRYPEAAGSIPYKNYDKNIADECIKIAEEILKWTKKKLSEK